jgi:predicted Rossmann fold nucleotide-binding protein DprA/Smf involved in DNA uptake
MRIAIVGSRRRTDRESVVACVAELAPDTVVVTGGARGPDQWAEEAGLARGLAVVACKPDLAGVRGRWEAAERHYARNQRIVDEADRIIAFVAPDRRGGTEDTIRRAECAGKPVDVR